LLAPAGKNLKIWVEAQVLIILRPVFTFDGSTLPTFSVFLASLSRYQHFLSRAISSHGWPQQSCSRKTTIHDVGPVSLWPTQGALPPETSPTPQENTSRRGGGSASGPFLVRPLCLCQPYFLGVCLGNLFALASNWSVSHLVVVFFFAHISIFSPKFQPRYLNRLLLDSGRQLHGVL